jgi:hypothetical protein
MVHTPFGNLFNRHGSARVLLAERDLSAATYGLDFEAHICTIANSSRIL